MASTDAKPIPQKNVAYRVTFPIFDADGDLVTGATGLDSEVSKDGGAFADCTNEATEIGSSGMYYLDLTSTEMNADTVAIIVKTSSSGAKTTPIVMYPEEAGDIRVNVTQFGSTNGTFSGGRPEVNTTHAAGTAWGSGAITAASIASDAITAAKIASDAITAAKIATGAITNAKFAAGAIDAAAIAADAIGASELAADAVTEIQNGLATSAALATVDGVVDTILSTQIGLVGYSQTVGGTGNDTTHIHLDINGTYGDDELNNQMLLIYDASTDTFHSRWITDYVGATSLATVATLPFTPASPDVYWLTRIRNDVSGGSGLDAAGVRAAVGLASANLDTQLADIETKVDDVETNLGTPSNLGSGATVSANLADIEAQTDNLPAIETKIDTIDDLLDTEIAAILADTNELQTDWANGGRLDNILDARASQASVDTIDSEVGVIDGLVDSIKVTTDKLDDTLEDDAGTYRFTTNALEQAPTGGSAPTVEQIADEVETRSLIVGTNNDKTGYGLADGAITAAKIATDAIDADALSADAIAEINATVDTALADYDAPTHAELVSEINSVQSDIATVDTVVDSIKVTIDKLDDTLEDDAGTYRFTENALEQGPSGGGGGASAAAIADAVWNERIDDHLGDRSFGAHVAIHLPAVSPDIDYKKIGKIVGDKIENLPKPETPKDFDYETIANGFEAILNAVKDIKLPDIPKTDFGPLQGQIEALQRDIKAIEIPETDLSATNSLITSKNDVLDLLAEAQEDIKNGQLERIREFFENGLDKIQSDIASLKDTFDKTQMVVLQDKPDKPKQEKKSSLDEYLKLK